jgi:hypothetical protein
VSLASQLVAVRAVVSLAFLSAILVTAQCGCRPKVADYTPSPATAEDAVRRALDAWMAGQPAGEIPDSKPVIHVTDAGRNPGQTLESYKILGESHSSSGRTFVVNLQLANPSEALKTEYIVVGIDPLWVFRKDDYELLMHWDHHMPAAPSVLDAE